MRVCMREGLGVEREMIVDTGMKQCQYGYEHGV